MTRMRLAGAANTLIIDQPAGTVRCENTDGAGLVRDLTHNLGVPLTGARVLMLGAGGAARGVTGPLLDAGCDHLTIVNRTAARAESLARHVRQLRALGDLPTPLTGGGLELLADAQRGAYDLVINATSAGLSGEMPDLPGIVAGGAFCYDMLYRDDTPFAVWARSNGARGIALGLGMLVEQAAESFYCWRGVRPDTAPVLRALREGAEREA